MSTGNFDPQTGKPLGQDGPKFDAQTGMPIGNEDHPSGGSKTGLYIGAGVAAIAIIAGIGVFAFNAVINSDPLKIVGRAALNTFKEDKFVETFKDAGKGFKGDQMSIAGTVSGGGDLAEFTVNTDKKGESASVSMDVEGLSINLNQYLDEDNLTISLEGGPALAYPYRTDKSGSQLFTLLTDNGMDADELQEGFDLVDKSLQVSYELMTSGKAAENKELQKKLAARVKDLTFEKRKEDDKLNKKDKTWDLSDEVEFDLAKAGASKYTVVETTLDSEWMKGVMSDVMESAYGDEDSELRKYLDDLLQYADAGYSDFGEIVDETLDELEDMPDIDVLFYIYNKQIVEIDLVAEDTPIRIGFAGDEIPWHDILIATDGDETLEVVTRETDRKSTVTFKEGGNDAAAAEYSYKDGAFTIDTGDEVLSGKLKADKNTISMEYDIEGITISMDITNKAKVEKAPKADDVTEMSQDDLVGLINDLSSLFY